MSESELAPRRAARRNFDSSGSLNSIKPATTRRETIATTEESARPIQPQTAAPKSDWVELTPKSFNSVFARIFANMAVWFGETAWLATGDRAKNTLLRLASHIAILAVVIGTAFLAASSAHAKPIIPQTKIIAAPSLNDPQDTYIRDNGPVLVDQPSVAPMANPFTIVPNRPRKDIVIYKVQPNDTLIQIAYLYGLKPETVLWANTDVLHDDPHYLTPGMELKIPPIDGIVYTVQSGDTVESIATKYKTTADAVYTDGALWNDLKPGQQPKVGATLIVPGGSRDFQIASIAVQTTYVGSQANSGFCKGTTPTVGSGTFIWPIAQHWISGNNYAPWHPGIDIAAHTGDSVYAVDAGTVVYAGWNNTGYGNLVVIDHGNGWVTYYAHNSVILVSCGQAVSQGQVISAAGSTGRSTGPHLHFETHLNGVPQNPFNVLPPP